MKKKTLALLLVLVMIFGISVGGTIAYLTDKETVTNTFTVGNVQIKLDELKVDEYGKPEGNERIEGVRDGKDYTNTYKLVPGTSYTKDPTVTVLKGSEPSYIRNIVTVTFDNVLTDAQLATQLDGIFEGESEKWVRVDKTVTVENEKTVITYEYRYTEIADARTAEVKLDPLFTGFVIPGTMDVTALGGFKLDVVAHAIQSASFDDAADAWGHWPTEE